MKVVKCEKCEEIFFEKDGSVGDHRSFETYLCAECSDEHEAEVVRYEEMESGLICKSPHTN
jgi:NAD-dependent SIR2 family protein deacetylase